MTYFTPQHRNSSNNFSRAAFGFTLVEMLMIVGFIGLFAVLAVSGGIDSYERGLAHSDRTFVLSALREARAQALVGMCHDATCAGPVAHGVFIPAPNARSLVIFEGPSYAARHAGEDETIAFSETEQVMGTSEIVFATRTGTVATDTAFTLRGTDVRTATFLVNANGRVSVQVVPSP